MSVKLMAASVLDVSFGAVFCDVVNCSYALQTAAAQTSERAGPVMARGITLGPSPLIPISKRQSRLKSHCKASVTDAALDMVSFTYHVPTAVLQIPNQQEVNRFKVCYAVLQHGSVRCLHTEPTRPHTRL